MCSIKDCYVVDVSYLWHILFPCINVGFSYWCHFICDWILCFPSRNVSKAIIIIGIQPLGRFWAETRAQSVDWYSFGTLHPGQVLRGSLPLLSPRLDVPTFATRCLNDARDPSGRRWSCGRVCFPVILPKWRLPRHLGIFYMPQIYDMGPTALLPLRRKACRGFFRP